jgi:hypothetical protein
MTDEVLTNLVNGSIMVCFGGFIAVLPHRFLHPFKGKAVPHSRAAMTFMRIGGSIVCLGGFRFVSISLWAIWNAGR